MQSYVFLARLSEESNIFTKRPCLLESGCTVSVPALPRSRCSGACRQVLQVPWKQCKGGYGATEVSFRAKAESKCVQSAAREMEVRLLVFSSCLRSGEQMDTVRLRYEETGKRIVEERLIGSVNIFIVTCLRRGQSRIEWKRL
jgi:hypothetical protein